MYEQVEESLVQMMGGCLSILKREGCALVGGHTSEGTEAAMGLSVNGTVHPDKVLHKGPCEAGHVLILTKPLGTGALMAADMRAKVHKRILTT
jgi:selenide,water dikinase